MSALFSILCFFVSGTIERNLMKVADSNLLTFVEGFYSSLHWSCKIRTLHDAKLSFISLGENCPLLKDKIVVT
jgi:hypothetical protein